MNKEILLKEPFLAENKRNNPSLFYPVGKSLIKITAVLLIVALNWTGLSAVIETMGYFNDTEDSPQNIFSASSLDFSLTLPSDFSPVVTPTTTASRDISLLNDGILGFQYTASTSNFSGELCDYLDLSAMLDGNFVASSSLKTFNYYSGDFSTSTDDWQFTATLTSNDPALQNKTCNFDFVFDGEQIEDAGFYDEEIISNTINSGIWLKIVINKVYYDVCNKKDGSCGEYKGKEDKNEWIELYNPTDQEINLKNWVICDNDDCETINPNVSIPALGFALIAHDNSTWIHYWEVPDDVVKIHQLGGGFIAMDNDADMLLLKNPDGNIIDQMNWGTPTTTWPNWNSNIWDPGVPDAPEGHILARVPTGIDTDAVSDWHDLGLPQVTVIWPNGGEILYVGRTYTLEWTATNPNGTDTELTIDIWYSKNSGNTWANIVTSTENDGKYDWRIPLCLDDGHGGCYYTPSHNARIKVAAFGPENFMVQNWDMSDGDFCPPIDYELLTPEEIEMLKELGLMEEFVGDSPENEETPTSTEEIISDEDIQQQDPESTTTEEITSTSTDTTPTSDIESITEEQTTSEESVTEETSNATEEQQDGLIDEINDIIDGIVDEIVEEIIPDESTDESLEDSAEIQTDEEQFIEQAPIDETVIIEQVPAIEEQPVVVSNNDSAGNSADPNGNGESGDSTSDSQTGPSVDSIQAQAGE